MDLSHTEETASAVQAASLNLKLAVEKAVNEWNEVVIDFFNHALDRFPTSVYEYMMSGRHALIPDNQGLHYSIERTGVNFDGIELPYSGQAVLNKGLSSTLSAVKANPDRKPRRFLPINTPQLLRDELIILWDNHVDSNVTVRIPYYGYKEGKSRKDSGHSVANFSCYSFLLKARSPYFRDILGDVVDTSDTSTITLPPTRIQPHIWEIVFCFISTGICRFQWSTRSNSSDLAKALSVYQAAQMVYLPSLQSIMSGVIIQILHGLYHAPISSELYDQLIQGDWKIMTEKTGCACERCAHTIPYVLQQLQERGIEDSALQRGVRRSLVGFFGPNWCTEEFAELSGSLRISIINDLRLMMIPSNIFSLLFTAEKALRNLPGNGEWNEVARSTILVARNYMDKTLQQRYLECFDCREWIEIRTLAGIGIHYSRSENRSENELKLGWLVDAVVRAFPVSSSPRPSVIHQKILEPFNEVDDPTILPELQNMTWMREIGRLKAYQPAPGGERSLDQEAAKETSPNEWTPFSDFYRKENTSVLTLDSYMTAVTHKSNTTYDSLLTSTFSHASSRTASTNYGLFYTRRAFSLDFTEE